MKTLFISSVLVLLSICLKAQTNENLTIGKKEIIYSKLLKENRTISIYTPEMTAQVLSQGKRYPVLYVLDGDAHLFSSVGIIQQLSQANGNGVLPEMIIVSIENTNRLRDLVPSDDLTKINPFVEFLSTELIPYIDKNYSTAPYKVLVGHSLGGLTAINMLTTHSQLFNAYIAIDPSMWYNNEKFLNNTIVQFAKQNMKGKRLFVGIANTMPKGMTLPQLKKDNSNETVHIRSIFKLNEFLKTNKNGLLYGQKYYDNESHNSIPLITEYDGLRFIFDYFNFDATEKDFADSTALIASKIKSHYANVSEKMGYKNSAPEALINYLAYDALGKNHLNKAQELFKLNIESYPISSNVYDSYADYFLVKKDSVNAVINYKKALAINNNALTLGKLNAITLPKKANTAVDLQKYTGIYTLIEFNIDLKLEVRDGKLIAIVPGTEDSELLSISENVFSVKGKQGSTVTFEMDGVKPKGFTSVEPIGTFKAIFKNK